MLCLLYEHPLTHFHTYAVPISRAAKNFRAAASSRITWPTHRWDQTCAQQLRVVLPDPLTGGTRLERSSFESSCLTHALTGGTKLALSSFESSCLTHSQVGPDLPTKTAPLHYIFNDWGKKTNKTIYIYIRQSSSSKFDKNTQIMWDSDLKNEDKINFYSLFLI